uniref:Uncharacterized protein n=1 Tax=Parascaris equorum TaxID=6256 RepID=A0A914SDU8_PAREQ
MSLVGKPLLYKNYRTDQRFRRVQSKMHNFLERPRGWKAAGYHLAVNTSIDISRQEHLYAKIAICDGIVQNHRDQIMTSMEQHFDGRSCVMEKSNKIALMSAFSQMASVRKDVEAREHHAESVPFSSPTTFCKLKRFRSKNLQCAIKTGMFFSSADSATPICSIQQESALNTNTDIDKHMHTHSYYRNIITASYNEVNLTLPELPLAYAFPSLLEDIIVIMASVIVLCIGATGQVSFNDTFQISSI